MKTAFVHNIKEVKLSPKGKKRWRRIGLRRDFSLSRYKEDVFEEIEYELPAVILDRLLAAKLGEEFFNHGKHGEHRKFKDGIVGESLELREMIG